MEKEAAAAAVAALGESAGEGEEEVAAAASARAAANLSEAAAKFLAADERQPGLPAVPALASPAVLLLGSLLKAAGMALPFGVLLLLLLPLLRLTGRVEVMLSALANADGKAASAAAGSVCAREMLPLDLECA